MVGNPTLYFWVHSMLQCDDSHKLIVELADVISETECTELIQRIEDLTPTLAPINTASGNSIHTNIRNNERVMFDDPKLAAKVFEPAAEFLPQEFAGRTIVGANERFRCYRYKPGMRFAPHPDGSFVRNESEKSFYSFLIYLNENFEGGETTFFTKPEVIVKPITGDGLLFQHPLIHEGSIVTSGTKYVARTDIMYRKK